MKKVVAMMLTVLMLLNTALAYTSTVQVKGLGVIVTSNVGNVVEITPTSDEITGWVVRSGDTTVENNQFVMPAGNVVIEGVTKNGYMLTVEMPNFKRSEIKEVGESVTVEAVTVNNGYSFSGWTATGITLSGSQQTNKVITFTMPANAVNLVANYTEKQTYTVMYNVNGGTGAIANQEKTEGIALTLTNDKPTRNGYTFLGWSTSKSATSAEYASGGSFTTDAEVTLYAVWKQRTVDVDTSGANAPVLIDGLTPVNWNGSDWEDTTEAAWEYNYNSVAEITAGGNKVGAWANARTADGSMYVWIPRYTYKIVSGYHSSGNSWNNLDSAGTNKIEIKFSDGIVDDYTSGAANATEGYIKHPAFTFGDDELKGFWMAKYEASQGTNTNTTSTINKPTATNYVAQSKPGVSSWRDISVSKMYEYAYNTFRNADSHLMKNSEWGAVAYLTNAIGRIPYINNNSNYITGIAGGSQDASESTSTTNSWNTAKGVKASTTHNVFGIYDLSGGAWEYVSAYYTGGDSSYLSGDTSSKSYAGVLYTNRNTKYVETYDTAYTSSKTGDAVYETSSSSSGNTSWDSDYSSAPVSSRPVFVRGGYYDYSLYAGVFYFNSVNGGASSGGFRPVLSIK